MGAIQNETFRFRNSNDTLIGMSKYRMEACPLISYYLVFQSKQGPIFVYDISKKEEKKFSKELTFDFSKFKFQNGL